VREQRPTAVAIATAIVICNNNSSSRSVNSSKVMARKSEKKKKQKPDSTTLAVHKKQQLDELLEAAASCKTSAIQRFLAAGGNADALVASSSPEFEYKVPLLVEATVGHHVFENTGSMQALIDAGATVDLTFRTTEGHRTALQVARSFDCCDAPVQLLLQHGADPCMRCFGTDGNFFTALQNAAMHGSVSKCQLLLDTGAARTLDQKNLQGWTAIHCAAIEGHVEVVRLLHECGAKINFIDKSGCSLLHLAARYPALLQYVLQNSSVSINAVNEHGCTAVTLAAAAGVSASVQLLLQHGADPSIRDCDSRCAATFAANAGLTDVMEVLLEHNAPATLATVYQGLPLLSLAVSAGHIAVVRQQLQHGADVHALSTVNEFNRSLCVRCTSARSTSGALQ
jgi:ankyrin repeat protein